MTMIAYIPPRNLCEPEPQRCRTATFPVFQPPISSRRIPLCRPANCENIQEGEPNLNVTGAGTLDRRDWLRGWVMTQLFTRGQIECTDAPPFIDHSRAGGWWADAFRSGEYVGGRGSAFVSGSKLWSLQWNHVNNQTLMMARQFALEAISYLLSWGIASKIDVAPWYISRNVMRLEILLKGPGLGTESIVVQGAALPDSTYLWEEYTGKTTVPPVWHYPRMRVGPDWFGNDPYDRNIRG